MTSIQDAFAPWRARHARRAWKPVCTDGPGAAQFGGSPLLATSERWPECVDCKKPMRLYVQIPLTSLPAGFELRGEGILQLFYCSNDDGTCETWQPFSGTHVVRLLNVPANTATPPPRLALLPARAIERWNAIVDYPHSEEHEELGLSYDYDFEAKRMSVSCEELGIEVRGVGFEAADEIGMPAEGDKLGGWPLWVQAPEYPACPECSARMEVVMQIDSEDNIPYMFGDGGVGHITQCPAHPNVLAFGWACL